MPKSKAMHPKTTYYNSFPQKPRRDSAICSVFWSIVNDYRSISRAERRNVVYPGKAAGLIVDAPRNERGVQINTNGDTSASGFQLTELGMKYYETCILPILGDNFVSKAPAPKRERRSSEGKSLAELKRGA